MKLHEYQSKELLRQRGLNVLASAVATSADEAREVAENLAAEGATRFAVKAQVHAGGRGKGGGIKLADTPQQAGEFAGAMLGNALITPQTGSQGVVVRQLLIEAGADIVQIDDPHLCLFVDPEVRRGYDDPDEAADFAVETVNTVVDGIEGVTLALHLCRRAGARGRGEDCFKGRFEPIIDQINRLKVHHVAMEFATPDAGELAVLARLREDMTIGLGCVDVTPGKIDSVETIVQRVRRATRFVSPSRITLNPDCGFAPDSGAVVSIEEAYRKLQNEVAAAHRLREEFKS